ncbi:alpha/beta fold hydrolase [Amycolatopsis sp. DSM 110486]|uniref:alpha/beta fold hydrolase n=1 Tax=Amycolatopsis sp. DSM 110486 TaxID=2865832 RepID=UPI001C6A19D5|nr:alpha/beta fold hydrolase [Amycolatopsis sp. DSM 110486]QYN19014.1 hypothetical protein K1T34_41065 [Amycolatopsis sp. DSM 110486]
MPLPLTHAFVQGDVPSAFSLCLDTLSGPISEPTWRVKPSWYLVATDDKMIPPPAQRAMSQRTHSTVVEAVGSHSIYVSQPAAVPALIQQAASAAVGG